MKKNQPKRKLTDVDQFNITLLIMAGGLCLPLVLLLIVPLTGYPEILEELFKVLFIFALIFKMPNLRQRMIWGSVFGLLFGLTEALLYINNLTQYGDVAKIYWRFALTVPMHIFTVLLVVIFSHNKKYLAIGAGILLAVLVHYGFNLIVS